MGVIGNFFSNAQFGNFISNLFIGGWYQFVFPFMLVYAIVFTILNKVDIFKNKKSVKVIIALVFAFFSIAFPITGDAANCGIKTSPYVSSGSCQTLGDFMMVLFPGVTAFSIGILALYIVAAMLGVDLVKFFGDTKEDNKIIKYILGGLGLFVVLYYYARGFGWLGFQNGVTNWWLYSLFRDPTLYILVISGFIFYWISKDDGDNSSGSGDSH